jgi:hypothetical protein
VQTRDPENPPTPGTLGDDIFGPYGSTKRGSLNIWEKALAAISAAERRERRPTSGGL